MKEQAKVSTAKEERKLVYYIAALAVINFILWFIAGSTNTTYPGNGAGRSLLSKLLFLYMGVIIGGVIVGVFVSLIPFKGLSFGHKYFRSSLLSILVLSVLLLIFIIRSIVNF